MFLGLAGAAFAVQAAGPSISYQIANIGTAILGSCAIFILIVWWARFFRGSWRWRLAPLLMLVLAGGVGLAIYEPVGFSGELVPQFRNRWSEREAPATQAAESQFADNGTTIISINEIAYPGFMGAERNGEIVKGSFPTNWNAQKPSRLWSQAVGGGLAGISVVKVRAGSAEEANERWLLYTLEQRDQEEWITCYDARDGQLVWFHSHPGFHTHLLGDTGPRSTPTVDDEGRVYAQGATGNVWCLDAFTGKLLWFVELTKLAGIDQVTSEKDVLWGRSGSPLRVDELVILPFGGDARGPQGTKTLIALDAATGETRWTSGDHQISYASPIVATLHGVRQIVSVDEDYASGTRVDDGEVLWTHPWPGKSNTGANCSNPVVWDKDKILLSKEYGGGAELIQVSVENDQWSTATLWANNRVMKTKFTNAVVRDGYAYGLSNGMLECIAMESGDKQWTQPRSGRFGHGHVLLADDLLICSSEEGELALVRATPDAYEELGRFQAVEGKTWNPFAVVGNRFFVRNTTEMAAYEFPEETFTTKTEATSEPAAPESQTAPRNDD